MHHTADPGRSNASPHCAAPLIPGTLHPTGGAIFRSFYPQQILKLYSHGFINHHNRIISLSFPVPAIICIF